MGKPQVSGSTRVILLLALCCCINGQNTTIMATPAATIITTTTQQPATTAATTTTTTTTATSSTESATTTIKNATTDNAQSTSARITITLGISTNNPANSSDPELTTQSQPTTSSTEVTTGTIAGITSSGSGDETPSSVVTDETTATTPAVTESPSTPPPSTTGVTTTTESTTVTEKTTTSATTPVTTTPEISTTTESTTTPKPPTTTGSSTTTTETTTRKAPPSDNTGWVVPVVVILFVLVLILFFCVLRYYRTGKTLSNCFSKSDDTSHIINMQPTQGGNVSQNTAGQMLIGIEDFETNHRRKVADDGRGYREEFRAIQTERSGTEHARNQDNVAKNRYDNVVPWDKSRVRLTVPPSGKPCDDYINANFVPGYMQDKKFIACQGPKENTCNDFWQMMWEQNCATIVMVTNLVEANKLKCHQYWPGDDQNVGESAKFGVYLVTTVDVKIRTFYIVRTFKLQYIDRYNESEQKLDYPSRIIRQFHYIAWPDFGVPKNAHEMLLFRRRVVAANPPHSGPIVVHCSAGVGRTGTFILIDAAMEQLQAEGKVDLFSFLTYMRKSRMMLVQTDAQYTFAHAAILEHIKYGDTEISVKKFRNQVQNLREQAEGSHGTLLEEEFNSLLKVQLDKDNMKHGRQSIKKNRVLQIIPYDSNRVVLPLKPGQEKTDYINASFIEGFKVRNAFIATQGPLADTTADFWLMAWITRSQNIVMLTALVEKGHDMCSRYWPEEIDEEETYGDITVKYVQKDDDDVVDYIVREFVMTKSSAPGEERKIRQFHYTGWPEVGLPSDAHGMIEISNRLTPKDISGNVTPTIVHCSSGGGRTGVFIGLNVLMEQADCEGLVDVFQTVKSLRAQRPHVIQTQEQLYFCYAALLQYLETNQLAGDNATLSSNVNSSIENQSTSVAASNSAAAPSTFLRVEDTTPQGSMNNKLDTTSLPDADTKPNGQTVVITDLDAPDEKSEDGEEPNVQIEGVGSPASQSTDSVSQFLLKNDENSPSSSSNSDFEIVNENAISI